MARVPSVGGRDAETGDDGHFCPGCGARQKFVPRYPWYLCRDCLQLAEDHEGRRLVFQNISPLGGIGWRYADDADASLAPCSAVVCLVRKREVLVSEARFGGVVAEPLITPGPMGQNMPGVLRLSSGSQPPAKDPRPKAQAPGIKP